MFSLRYPWLWWGLGWLLVAGVVAGSLLPGVDLDLPVFVLNDKVVHAASYCMLTLWFAGLVHRGRSLVAVAGLMFLLGLALDVSQGIVAGRSFDLWDVAANGGGILVAFVVAHFVLAGWCARIERLVPV